MLIDGRVPDAFKHPFYEEPLPIYNDWKEQGLDGIGLDIHLMPQYIMGLLKSK